MRTASFLEYLLGPKLYRLSSLSNEFTQSVVSSTKPSMIHLIFMNSSGSVNVVPSNLSARQSIMHELTIVQKLGAFLAPWPVPRRGVSDVLVYDSSDIPICVRTW